VSHDDVEGVLAQIVEDGVVPGVAASVVSRGGFRRRFCAGTLTCEPGAFAVDERTVFDLASVTKLLCTTALVARAVDEGVIALHEAPWPGWPGVTVAHALRHDGGLRAHDAFFDVVRARGVAELAVARDVVVDAVLATPPVDRPGSRTLYSDLGFIALGALIEERRGRPLDEQLVDVVPPGSGLSFVRLASRGYHEALPRVAPTERCAWRRRVVHGQVHDENAYAMGGVAGHAGLFGSLADVEAAALAMLEALLGDTTLARFAREPGARGLGFDRPTEGGSTGEALSSSSVGHLGFTGTSVWLDPACDGGAVFVLLSNSVHLGRGDVVARSRTLRRAFHRAAAAAVARSAAARA
jgi:CubicO group peptidase (beta-lactamase class C family)